MMIDPMHRWCHCWSGACKRGLAVYQPALGFVDLSWMVYHGSCDWSHIRMLDGNSSECSSMGKFNMMDLSFAILLFKEYWRFGGARVRLRQQLQSSPTQPLKFTIQSPAAILRMRSAVSHWIYCPFRPAVAAWSNGDSTWFPVTLVSRTISTSTPPTFVAAFDLLHQQQHLHLHLHPHLRTFKASASNRPINQTIKPPTHRQQYS